MFNFIKRLFKKDTIKGTKAKNKINEWSYQRFARFYGDRVLKDPKFKEKLESIIDSVNNKKMDNIDEIAQRANCSYDECIMKLNYLKNKRVLGDYSIDRINRTIKPLSSHDEEILKTYYDMIYVKHYQISEIAKLVPNYHNKPISIIEEDVFKDIKYLYDKSIVNGIKLDESSNEIKYYTIEKHEKSKDYSTISCPKCGALVDVKKKASARCDYCSTLVEDK